MAKFEPPSVEPFGIDGFRLMLQQQGLDIEQIRLRAALQAPEETVIVLIGDVTDAKRIRSDLAKFVSQGGALFVATDLGGPARQGTQRMSWLNGSQFLNSRVTFPSKDRLQPRLSDCPIVTSLDRNSSLGLFDGVRSIAANRPGYLHVSKFVKAIAWLPKPASRNQQAAPLMAINQIGKGRMLLVADQSIFINEMLIHADNARFASNVANWLTADGNRKRLVVCHNNQLLSEWSFAGTPPSIPLDDLLKSVSRNGLNGLPTGDALFPILNQSLTDFQRQGGFHQMVRKLTGSRIPNGNKSKRNLQRPLILASLLLLVIAIRWVFGTRGRAQKWLFDQENKPRHESRLTAAVSEQQNRPYLRTLAREFFAESGITRFSEQENYPKVVLHEAIGSKSNGREIRTLWEIATNSKTRPLPPKKFRDLLESLRRLHFLQSQGQLELE